MNTFIKKVKAQEQKLTVHEKKKSALHQKEREKSGHTEVHRIEEIRAMGVDTGSIIKGFKKAEKDLKSAHKGFLELETQSDAVADLLADLPALLPRDPNVIYLYPPCVDGWGGGGFTDEDCGFNLARGETNFKHAVQGEGWGLMATGVGRKTSTLVFRFTPPREGNMLVDSFVDFNGVFAISAHDHVYTSTNAKINLKVSSRLYQHYWEEGPVATVIDEYHTDSGNSGTINQRVKLHFSTSVSANDPVYIFIKLELVISAHSSHARAELDFRTGASRYVKVPFIRFTYL